MKLKRITIAVIVFLLPFIIRGVWFYRGIYFPNTNIDTPDFEEFSVIQPPLSTMPAIPVNSYGARIRILFDQAHNNKYTSAEIESLRNLLLQQDAEILELDIKNDLTEMLNKVDAFVIITPADFYSIENIESIENFIQRGGRLLVIADPTRSYSEYDTEREKSVILVNEILEPFQITFRNDYAYNLVDNEGNYRNIFVIPETINDITKNISQLVFYAAHSIDSGPKILFRGSENTHSSLDDRADIVPVAAFDNSGKVLVIGDMTFLTTPYYQVADNHQLIVNISKFLLSGIRPRTLADFPYLFLNPVSIRLTEGVSLEKGLLEMISDFKKRMELDDIQVVLLDDKQEGFDQIILGIYPPGEQVKEFIKSFNIDFNNEPEERTLTPEISGEVLSDSSMMTENTVDEKYFYIPGFGSISSKGFGYFLFNPDKDNTNLVLLADSQENTVKLLNLLVKGNLDVCLSSDNIAVCPQDVVYYSTSEVNETVSMPDELSEEGLIEEPVVTSTPIPPLGTPSATETLSPSETPAPNETPVG